LKVFWAHSGSACVKAADEIDARTSSLDQQRGGNVEGKLFVQKKRSREFSLTNLSKADQIGVVAAAVAVAPFAFVACSFVVVAAVAEPFAAVASVVGTAVVLAVVGESNEEDRIILITIPLF
jgi:hypothetical protein